MTLKYPMEAGGVDSDYVTFTPLKYRTNADQRKGGAGAAAPTESGAQSVILYMPNSTPGMVRRNLLDLLVNFKKEPLEPSVEPWLELLVVQEFLTSLKVL